MNATVVIAETLLIVAMLASQADAHKPSDAHVRVALADGPHGEVDVAVRDLDAAITIDVNGDGRITWHELENATPRIERYLTDRLRFTASGRKCALALGDSGLVDLSDGAYWSQSFSARCTTGRNVALSYRLLFDIDAQHRGLVRVDGAHAQTLIVRDSSSIALDDAGETSVRDFVFEGIWHIWEGIDHLLFLAALILPAVWSPHRRGELHGAAKDTFRESAVEVLEIVTAFTLAHSITLVLSAVGFIRLPSRLVETAIAMSVVAAAVNNLTRAVDARWAVAFALGLLHGFGFSSVLVDLGLPSHELIGALLGFNIGVELGQAAFVVIVLPLLFLIRRHFAYRVVLYGGSAVIALVASIWAYQRCFP